MKQEEGGFSSASVLLSFVLGGMVGAGLALLMAPQSGQDTRRKIRELAEEVKDKATDYVDHTKEMLLSKVEKGKEAIDDKKSAITAAFEAGKEAYEKELHK